ncbi:hypothetical protein ABIC78_003734 [Novosphingobium sp. 1529]|uniref:hypothetical protein n=1 Tax=Novosphingobium sp. 1529 TaxID=3156424 RepID=UPI00339A131A
MKQQFFICAAFVITATISPGVLAHTLHRKGQTTTVAQSSMSVTPSRDWNQLSKKIGKNAELWTLDGELLDEITFVGSIPPGQSLLKEKSKKRDPLPKFEISTLTAELPELWERTLRASKGVKSFTIKSTEPANFLKSPGVKFTFEYADDDYLVRSGEAYAASVDGKLYLIAYEAPRLGYFERYLNDFRKIVDSAKMN